jgi:glyoxylase-like metal-dependent hydrolase (beta-lactamase superfamily II)/rhodanese-related sulfurtransferase
VLFRQIIHEDLGCASYLVADRESGVAVVVDPQWDVEPYRRLARLHGVRIGHVLETHNHADHVSGHGRLARMTGATVHVNELAAAEYPHEPLGDGWALELGDLRIEAIHTPGHRPEHTCFLLSDDSRGGDPWALLSGDSLFIGDVARPDLAIEPTQGAAEMFRSLRERLLTLGDEVEVWPGHLGGSLCGGSGIDLKTSSTIGFERRHNPALGFDEEADFVASALRSLPDRPPNVAEIVALNRGPFVEGFGTPGAMTPHEVEEAVAAGAVVIDGRTNEEFDESHIAGALSTSAYDTGFATKVSRVAPPGAEVIVVAASDGDERDAAELLAAVGVRVRGFLEGGSWRHGSTALSRRWCSTSATAPSTPASTSRARSTSPMETSPAGSTSCPASGRSRRSAAAASAAASPPRSSSARASPTSSTSARASAPGATAATLSRSLKPPAPQSEQAQFYLLNFG